MEPLIFVPDHATYMWCTDIMILLYDGTLDLVVSSDGKLENKVLALQFLNSFATAKAICKDNLT